MDTRRIPRRRAAWLLFAITLVGAALRMLRLDTLPPALFRDEAEKVYNAWSFLQTARDVIGNLLPLFIEVFGVTTSAIYQYAAVPFLAAFGLNEWGARLPAASVGTATVVLTFFAGQALYGSQAGLWAALLLAQSPWHIVFSRWAQQGIFLPLLLATALLGLAEAVRAQRGRRRAIALSCAGACLAIAMYAYDVARLFVPLLIVGIGVIYWRFLREHWRTTLVAGVPFLLVLSPVLYLLLFRTDAAQSRFRFVTILQPGASAADVTLAFVRNYTAHFSPAFLLLQGDAELRHGAGVGVLTLLELIALLAGIGVLLVRRRREDLVLLWWLLLFPVAASLTRVGVPHALRSIVALPAVQIIAGVGISATLSRVPDRLKRSAPALLVLLAVLTFVPFARGYYSREYQVRSAVSWQYGIKRALQFLDEPTFRDATVYFDTTTVYGAEYLVAVYAKLDPRHVQEKRYGRYQFIAPGQTFSPPADRPAVYVHVPLTPGPAGWRPIAYFPLDEPGSRPALMVYLNPVLQERIRAEENSSR